MNKIYSILVGLFIVFSSFAQESKPDLKTRFDVIRNETVAGANTKTRIANAYQELADGTLGIYPVSASGTDTYTGFLQGLDAYSGRIVFVSFTNNNTGAATLNIGGIGAANIQKYDGGWGALEANDIIAGKLYRLYHDGTRFQLDLGGSSGSVDWGDIGGTLSDQTDLQTALNAKQPLDSDLTTIAGLTATTDNFLQSKSSAWASRTVAQVKTDLGLTGTNSGDQTITLTGDVTGSGTGSFAATLATVNGNVGSFGSATEVGGFTVNGKGLITAASNTTITPAVGSITGLGSGVGTWLATPSWTNFNSMITGTAPYWALTGTSTFTGAVTIVGSGSNTLKHTFNGLGVTQVNGAGQWLANETAAVLGAQQISPSVVWEGRGWETTGSTSQSVKYVAEILPVQGTTSSGLWRLRYSFNGGANQTVATVDQSSVSFQSSAGGYFSSTFQGVSTFSIAGGATVMALSGAGLPHVRIGANNNGFVVVSNDGVSSSLTGTGFGMSYRGIGGTAGVGANALHAPLYSGASINSWTGTYRQLWISQLAGSTIAPSSGTGGWIGLSLENIFNITSTAVATLKGVHYNPTMTATTSNTTHAAWEHTSGYVQWNSALSPSQITSNQNDYNPTGLNNGGAPHGASIMRVDTDASRNITSIVGGAAGRLLIVANVGSQNLVLKDDDGSTGTAANRIQLNADVTVLPEESVMLWYDGVSSRWRILK